MCCRKCKTLDMQVRYTTIRQPEKGYAKVEQELISIYHRIARKEFLDLFLYLD